MILQMLLMLHPSFLCRHASIRSPTTGSFSLRIDWSSCFLFTLDMNSDPEPSVFSFASLSGGNFSLRHSEIAAMSNTVKFHDLFVSAEGVKHGRIRLQVIGLKWPPLSIFKLLDLVQKEIAVKAVIA